MKRLFISTVGGLLLLAATGAEAVPVTNQTTYLNEIVNGGSGLFTDLTGSFSGIGTISRSYTAPGEYRVLSLIDNDLDFETTGFYPEFGGVVGTPGFSFQIGSPYDLIGNFLAGSLDNGSMSSLPDDVAVAMLWNFTLSSGEKATLNFTVSDQAPLLGSYLTHTDAVLLEPDYVEYDLLQDTIYYTSSLRIDPNGTNPVPEPSTLVLFGAGLAAAGFYARRRRNC